MEVLLGLVLADMAGGALLATDGVGAVDLEAVEGDEQAAAEALEGGEGTLLLQGVEVLYFGLFCMTIFGLFQTQIW